MTKPRQSKRPIVGFVTDFGLADGYVSELYAVVLAHCPEARLVDISHQIPPGDIRSGAFVLWRAASRFQAGTVFVAVVDPGVGSGRQAVIVRSHGKYFIGPDNGLLARVVDWRGKYEVRLLKSSGANISPTFHGRDLFAPAAGRLAAGEPFAEMGRQGKFRDTIPSAEPSQRAKNMEGEVIYIDSFGNIVTNLPAGLVGTLSLPGMRQIKQISCYEAGEPETPGWLVGSADLVEIAVKGGSAAQLLNAGIGDPVVMRLN